MATFIRVAEIWTPDADGHLLEFSGGLYGQAPEFGAVSRTMCFGRGEGLPGRVWDEGIPLVLSDLQAGSFQRAAAAKAAQLSCAAAFPVFFEQDLKAVVVLFCGEVAGQSGAIEVWRNDPAIDADMHWHDGIYGANDPAFEAASRRTVFAHGAGLVGQAWQQQASAFLDGLPASDAFVRAREAAGTPLTCGLAIPCPVPEQAHFVLTFLSAPSMPIARRIERWLPGDDLSSLKRAPGFGDGLAGLDAAAMAAMAAIPALDVEPTVLAAFASAVPKAGNGPHGAVIALPIISGGSVVETVAMTF